MDEKENRIFIHKIDRNNKIISYNNEWAEFAKENGAESLLDRVLGTDLFSYIAGHSTKCIYKLILGKVREKQITVRFPYHCDSPDIVRSFELEIVPFDNGDIEFRSYISQLEKRAPVNLLNPEITRSDEHLEMCSWCKRVKKVEWIEVEDAARELGLFKKEILPEIDHGICERCMDMVMKKAGLK